MTKINLLAKLKKNILLAFLFALLIFIALTFLSDFNSVKNSLKKFSVTSGTVLIFIMLGNFFFRFLKWHYYVKYLKIKISFKESLLIFFSALVMSVTPGKWGELLKSYFIKELTGEPVSKTAPIVFAERMTDIVSLILLALVGTYFYQYKTAGLISLSNIFIIILLLLGNNKAGKIVLDYVKRISFLKKYVPGMENLYFGSRKLLKTVPLLKMTVLSIITWIIEFFGFYIILLNFNTHISFLLSGFIYAISILIGSFSMLPGGLGFTEVSLTYLIELNGFTNGDSVAATMIVRIFTLWFSVLVGFFSLIIYKTVTKQNLNEIILKNK